MSSIRRIASSIITLMAAPTAAPVHAAPLGDWYGRYVWEEPLGRVGGSNPRESVAIFVNHSLTLGRPAGPTGCLLKVEGYQTYKQMRCTATPRGNGLVVKFYQLGPESNGGGYPRGAALFTLARTRAGLITRLQALEPSSDATPRRGRLFHRTR